MIQTVTVQLEKMCRFYSSSLMCIFFTSQRILSTYSMPGMILEARDVAKNQIEHLLLSWGDIPSTKGTNRIISDGTKFWLDQKIQSP